MSVITPTAEEKEIIIEDAVKEEGEKPKRRTTKKAAPAKQGAPRKKAQPKLPAPKEESIPAVAAKEEPAQIEDFPEEESEQKTAQKSSIQSAQEKSRKPDRYFEAVGRRKTAIARVRLYTKPGDFTVNDKLYSVYFPTIDQQKIAEDALQKMKLFGRFRVSALITGGGIHAQADALRHGLARCLTKFNPDFRKRLKRAGFIKRDPRAKERKKFGLKKARKAPQWAKR